MSLIEDSNKNNQRLRYEAFSNFATDLNKSTNFKEIGDSLSTHLKFLLNFLIFRAYFQYEHITLVFHIYRGTVTIYENDSEDNVMPFEKTTVLRNLPVEYTIEEIGLNELLQNGIFDNPKVKVLYAMPITYSPQKSMLITMASKDVNHLLDLDFRFIRLVSESLYNKVSQLLLLKEIEIKNNELRSRNKEVTQLNYNLESLVKKRTLALTEANIELSTLFYRTSHDFRAPLANVLGIVDLLKLFVEERDAFALIENCEHVVHKLDKMLTKLNALGNIEAGNELVFIDFKVLISEIHAKFSKEISDLNIQMVIDYPENLAFRSSFFFLSTILENLVENAVCFRRDEPVIKINVEYHADRLNLVVYDNGQGILPLINERIFEMYFRGNSASDGNGLGLYVVKKMITALKGDISISSISGEYTQVNISLPVL
ncbi:sensor histidine kinase [Daejeonella oryzae]|uniref:sensor histidine kinase n=1 Tax=Daejeonella oryzae TaxID=1122943 RepID=UPI00040F6197|nr:HAMP domain-containing sensor histidine kinase [Daejeonella oryzae]